MPIWLQATMAIFSALMGSTGLWALIQSNKKYRKDNSEAVQKNAEAMQKIVMGLAYTELKDRGSAYIQRGWVTREEFEDYQKYFYQPYKALGGNGLADRIHNDVISLPFYRPDLYIELKHSKHKVEDVTHDDKQNSAHAGTVSEQRQV
jgi:hypothetical protein